MPPSPLSPGREARLKLAVFDAWDAKTGDPDIFRAKVEHVVHLHQRLTAEEAAEHGYLPTTLDGCIAVLHVAARIVTLITGGPRDELA